VDVLLVYAGIIVSCVAGFVLADNDMCLAILQCDPWHSLMFWSIILEAWESRLVIILLQYFQMYCAC